MLHLVFQAMRQKKNRLEKQVTYQDVRNIVGKNVIVEAHQSARCEPVKRQQEQE